MEKRNTLDNYFLSLVNMDYVDTNDTFTDDSGKIHIRLSISLMMPFTDRWKIQNIHSLLRATFRILQ